MKTEALFYENKIRVRVCGLIIKNNKILLVKHRLKGSVFYGPPGGAVEFGEDLTTTLKRELHEETNIEVTSSNFQFITEYINPPLHAIEMFYHITKWNGIIKAGTDPENKHLNVIEGVKWFTLNELKKIKTTQTHHLFHNCNNLRDILALSGYISYPTLYTK